MRRPIILFAISAGLLALLAFLFLREPAKGAVLVRPEGGEGNEPWTGIDTTELWVGQEYQLKVDGYDDPERLSWTIAREGGNEEFLLANKVPVHTFVDAGNYSVALIHELKEVARGTFHVRLGETFVVQWPEERSVEFGSTFEFAHGSTHVAERKWTVLLGDSILEESDEDAWSWTPDSIGDYRVRFHVTMNSGAEHADSTNLQVTAPPAPPEPEPTPPAPEPRREYKPRDPAPPKPAPKPVEKVEPAPVAAPTGPWFGDKKKRLSSTVMFNVGKPERTNATFRKGSAEFRVEVEEDCRLTGFRHFGNSKAGWNKITVTCVTEGCEGASCSTSTGFTAAQDDKGSAETRDLSLPVFLKGKTYLVRIETTGDAELGFFELASSGFSTSAARILFSENSSCVFDVTFVK